MEKLCPLCGSKVTSKLDYDNDFEFYNCPVCGRFELKAFENHNNIDYNKTASYVFYKKYSSQDVNKTEYRYHTIRAKEECDLSKCDFEKRSKASGIPVHMDADIIDAWFPKLLSERVEYILDYLGRKSKYFGERLTFSYQEMLSLLFIDRNTLLGGGSTFVKKEKRDISICISEAQYILNCISEMGYISHKFGNTVASLHITITPKGYSRIDVLQRNTANGRAVFVAMKFGDDTKRVREAIRSGITKAGYLAVFIDEVQHNDYITPELLKHVRDSKFVVVDLTNKNNGAYFEEGYAMGLGKPVIQLCKKKTKLHFDIAQKNTIIWDTEDDISDRLCNRIRATID